MEDHGNIAIFSGNEDEVKRDLPQKINALQPYLEIAPPVSPQQSVEFSQVFRLPLSRSFQSLYNTVYTLTDTLESRTLSVREGPEYKKSNVKLIDLRPKRWYKQFEQINRRIKVLEEKKSNLDAYIAIFSAKLKIEVPKERALEEEAPKDGAPKESSPEDSEAKYAENEKKYIQSVLAYEAVSEEVDRLEQQRQTIIREIMEAGYLHSQDENKKDKISVPIIDATKSQKDFPILKPEDITPEKIRTNWAVEKIGIVAILRAKLLIENNALISPEKTSRFEREIENLASNNVNPSITATIQRYEKEIADLGAEIAKQEDNIKNADQQSNDDIERQLAIYTQKIQNNNITMSECQKLLGRLEAVIKGDIKRDFNIPTLLATQYKGMTEDQLLDYLMYDNRDRNSGIDQFRRRHMDKDKEFHTTWENVLSVHQRFHQAKNELEGLQREKENLQEEGAQKELLRKKIIAEATERMQTCKSQQALVSSKLDTYKSEALLQARAQFIAEWNDPQNYDFQITQVRVDEKADPLKDFYDQVNRTLGYRNVYRFIPHAGEFYTDSGLPLFEFLSSSEKERKAVIFPFLNSQGEASVELYWGVIAPRQATSKFNPQLPIVKFVETHEMQISWNGYSLSALSESVNLFPGEKKQIIVEKRTKLTRTVTQSKKENQEEQRHLTSSFEENLRTELSTQLNQSNSEQRTNKSQQSQSNKEQSGSQSSSSREEGDSKSVSAGGSFFDSVLKVDAGASSQTKRTKANAQSQSKEAAFLISQSDEGQTLNKTTRDISSKNLQNTVKKVSSETSSNNKLEISSSTSEQTEESTVDKETMQIENPNVGRTVNYNFYQIQNRYRTQIFLKDVKIVLDTGIPVMDGVDVTIKVVCEVELFNKLLKVLPKNEYSTVLCAFIARRVLKNYARLISEPSNDGILKLKVGPWEKEVELIAQVQAIYKRLDMVLEGIERKKSEDPNEDNSKFEAALKNKISDLQQALIALQKFTFELGRSVLLDESQHVVNAPAYHVDTQIGQSPATEEYLEKRREGELDAQKAKTDLVRARAEHKRDKAHWMEFHANATGARVIDNYPEDKTKQPSSLARTSLSGQGNH